MNLAERLNTYIDGQDRKQAAVAMSWLEAWKKHGGKPWSDTTVTSNLNRLLKDNPQGVRFFFEDRARAAILLSVLGVPDAEHAELLEMADRALKAGGSPPRLIFDATGLPTGGEHAVALAAEIKERLIAQGPFPIALVLLKEQYDVLPRSFDDLKEKGQLRYVHASNPDEGWERVQELAEEQGLVLSARRFHDFERWLATEFSGKQLLFGPSDGLERFRTSGRLPGLTQVEHNLATLVPEEAERPTNIPASPGQLRQLMHELGSEQDSAALKLPPESRQWLARQLGVTATSTARERTEAAIAAFARELPVDLTPCSAEELQQHQVRAGRRQVGPLALRVGDTVHLLNLGPEARARAEGHPWVQVHDIPPRPTALGRLLEAVDPWTKGDYLADPFLEHVIARLDPKAQETEAFLHARASLLHTEALQPKAAPLVEDWQRALEELLAGRPPHASLHIRVNEYKQPYREPRRIVGTRPGFIVTRPYVERATGAKLVAMHKLMPMADVLVSRGDEALFAVTVKQERTHSSYYGDSVGDGLLLPAGAAAARDTGLWLDFFEASFRKKDAASRDSSELRQKALSGFALADRLRWQLTPIELPPSLWEQADLEVAMTWWALQRALAAGQYIPLPDGAVLLRLNGAFFAELRITPLSDSHPPASVRASLLIEPEVEIHTSPETLQATADNFMHFVATHTATGGYDFGARLPRSLLLLGKRFRADVLFRGSALFGELPLPAPAAAAFAQAEERRKAEEQKRRDDDDDDDD